MASTPNLLAIPLEIRYQVYSHLLIYEFVVNINHGFAIYPLRNGVVRACRQTFYEMIEYYYANNTFSLFLLPSSEMRPAMLQRLRDVQHLQVDLGDLVLSPTVKAFFLPVHTQQRCDWFLKGLRHTKQGQEGRFLKTLVAIDRCGASIVSELVKPRSNFREIGLWRELRRLDVKRWKLTERINRSIPPTAQIWKDQKRREEKRREVLANVLRPLCHDINKIIIESRAMSEERNEWGRLSVQFLQLLILASLTHRQPIIGTWFSVLVKLGHWREVDSVRFPNEAIHISHQSTTRYFEAIGQLRDLQGRRLDPAGLLPGTGLAS